MAQKPEDDKKRMNPLLWFLVAIVLPGIFVLFLVVMIMTMAGVDVTGWAKEKVSHLPVVSEVFSDNENQDKQEANAKVREKAEEKDEKIESLQNEISMLKSNVDELKKHNAELKSQKKAEDSQEDHHKKETSERDPVSDIASSFSDMDSEQAARVLQTMEQDLAVSILEEISHDARGEIFDAMDADYAAALTKQFVNQTE